MSVRTQLGLTREQMALSSGIPLSTLIKYEGDARTPGGEALGGLGRMGIDLTWLLTGEATPVSSGAPSHKVEQPRAGYVYLPLYDVRAAAGNGHLNEAENAVDVLAFKEDWIRRELRSSPADLNLIYVQGDSMEPDLRSGDIVLLDHTDTMARREGVYVIRMDGALLVKQLQRLPGGLVKVISRNVAYEPFTVPLQALESPNGFAVVGRVVWACRRF